MKTFEEDLEQAASYHGHICAGQILGVRMARLGCRLLGIDDPVGFRDLAVYIECDRCLTDAIGTVTGCKLGKRTLKWKDYGKSAATFLNLKTGEAYRIYKKTKKRAPKGTDLAAFFSMIPDDEMFTYKKVRVFYDERDLPGKPVEAEVCSLCGEEVADGRHLLKEGRPVCKSCNMEARERYYEEIE